MCGEGGRSYSLPSAQPHTTYTHSHHTHLHAHTPHIPNLHTHVYTLHTHTPHTPTHTHVYTLHTHHTLTPPTCIHTHHRHLHTHTHPYTPYTLTHLLTHTHTQQPLAGDSSELTFQGEDHPSIFPFLPESSGATRQRGQNTHTAHPPPGSELSSERGF